MDEEMKKSLNEAAAKLFSKEGLKKREKELLKKAKAGDIDAMKSLASLYRGDQNVDNRLIWKGDTNKAIKYYEMAAKKGDIDSMLSAAKDYEKYKKNSSSDKKAFRWYKTAAEEGNIEGLLNTARCYLKGKGTPSDPQKAYLYYGKAAEAGASLGFLRQAQLDELGLGTKLSFENAEQKYLKIIRNAHGRIALCRLAMLARAGKYSVPGMSQIELEKKCYAEAIKSNWMGNKANENWNSRRNSIDLETLDTESKKLTATNSKKGFLDYYDAARSDLNQKNYAGTLDNIRQSLEGLIKTLCSLCELENSTKLKSLEEMIQDLEAMGVIDQARADNYNYIRRKSNPGHHFGVDFNEASVQETFDLFFKELSSLDKHGSLRPINISREPERNPEYHSPSRRYFRKWAHCMDRPSLEAVEDYLSLEQEAKNGNITAMLDLASGFLSPKSEFNQDGMVVITQYSQAYRFSNGVPDGRYYYWILKAALQSAEDFSSGNMANIPVRFISTALLEAILYRLYSFYKPDIDYSKMRNLTRAMFGEDIQSLTEIDDNLENERMLLNSLLNVYGYDIISKTLGNYRINSLLRINHLYNCYEVILNRIKRKASLPSQLRLIPITRKDEIELDAQSLECSEKQIAKAWKNSVFKGFYVYTSVLLELFQEDPVCAYHNNRLRQIPYDHFKPVW